MMSPGKLGNFRESCVSALFQHFVIRDLHTPGQEAMLQDHVSFRRKNREKNERSHTECSKRVKEGPRAAPTVAADASLLHSHDAFHAQTGLAPQHAVPSHSIEADTLTEYTSDCCLERGT